MTMDAFDRANEELKARGKLKEREKASFFGISEQDWYNWGHRKGGIPPKHHDRVAKRLSWTVDKLLHGPQGEKVVRLSERLSKVESGLLDDVRSALVLTRKAPGAHRRLLESVKAAIVYCKTLIPPDVVPDPGATSEGSDVPPVRTRASGKEGAGKNKP